ncbi:MAG: response regulator, partial [Candidatus Hydrogenedentota bacterium]
MEQGSALALPMREDGAPIRFLCVDDSEFMLKSLRQIITSFGGEVVDFAHDGLEALHKYQGLADQIDIVTLDITMPNMDGLTCLDKLREMNPKVRIIMISALGSGEVVKTAILKGAKHFIVKPFQRQKVYEASVSV